MIAVLCRTPVHVFRTVQMKSVIWKDEDVDVYVFDSFGGAIRVSERLQNSGLFSHVLYIEDSTFFLHKGPFKTVRTILGRTLFKKELSKRYYDELYSFNIYGIANEVAFNILKKKNRNLKFNIVEDGPSVYPIVKKTLKSNRYVFPLLGLKSAQDNVDFWWFSMPELMESFGSGKKKRLPIVDKSDVLFCKIINEIFDFHSNEEFENADILFMEECFYNDGLMKENCDLELFKKIRDVVPDARCIVKLHPRSRENRFANDFYVIPADGIPWEVYVLNYSVSNKILVSIGCSTMVSSKVIFNDETYSLLLYPILKDKVIDKKTGDSYFTMESIKKLELQRTVYSDQSKYVIAYDVQQAMDTVRKWLKHRDNGGKR